MKKQLLLLSLVLATSLAGCKKNDEPANVDLALNADKATLYLATAPQMTLAVKTPETFATDSRLTWHSSHPDVAKVDKQTGEVTALKPGKAFITGFIYGLNAVRGICEVTVSGSLGAELSGLEASYDMQTGDTLNLNYGYIPQPATCWELDVESSDSIGIQQVKQLVNTSDAKQKGKLRFVALNAGEVEVTLINRYDRQTRKSFTLMISSVALERLEFTNTETTVKLGDVLKMEVGFVPAQAKFRALSFRSDNEAVFTVDAKGVITPISKGLAKVFVMADNGAVQTSREITVMEGDNTKGLLFGKPSYSMITGDDTSLITVSADPAVGSPAISLRQDFSYQPKVGAVTTVVLQALNSAGTRWAMTAPLGITGSGSARVIATNGIKDKDGKLLADTCIVNVADIIPQLVSFKASYQGVDLGRKVLVEAALRNYSSQSVTLDKATFYIAKGTVVAPKDTLKADKVLETLNPQLIATPTEGGSLVRCFTKEVPTNKAHIAGYSILYECTINGVKYAIRRKAIANNGVSFAGLKED